MIKESKDSNEKLQEDKAQMSQHFKYLVEQTQSKQQEIEKIDKQMELTLKLSDAKLTKVQMESAIERENLVKYFCLNISLIFFNYKEISFQRIETMPSAAGRVPDEGKVP